MVILLRIIFFMQKKMQMMYQQMYRITHMHYLPQILVTFYQIRKRLLEVVLAGLILIMQ